MPPIVPIIGVVALLGWLLSRGSGGRKKIGSGSSVTVETPLPTDPLKKPIIVTSPPSPGVPKDVQKEVDRVKNATSKKAPYKAPPSERTVAQKNRPAAASKPFGPPKPAEPVIVKKSEDGVVTTYKVTPPPAAPSPLTLLSPADTAKWAEAQANALPADRLTDAEREATKPKVEVVKVAVVPMEGTPPISLLSHSIMARPIGPVPKLTKIVNSAQAKNYALQAFHAIVDFVEKAPNKPAEVAAFAAKQYMDAANYASSGGAFSKAMEALRKGNALSDKAIKERKSA